VLPCWAVVTARGDPAEMVGAAFLLVGAAIVLWMKLVSYVHCGFDCRDRRRTGEPLPGEKGFEGAVEDAPGAVSYPDNLTASNLLYYVAAPTLTYQVNFPRSPKVRLKWLARRALESLVAGAVLLIMTDQYLIPAFANSMMPFHRMDWSLMLERILKVSLPMLYVWLTGSYLLFHLLLNISGELLRFGDREFYRDWWNAATLEDYWRLWNMPVHRWMLRTVYFPCLRLKVPRQGAVLAVFFVSAVFHELVVGVPLRMFRAWAFLGIMLQIPLIMATRWMASRLKNQKLGNIAFWVSFCIIGQPVSAIMYYHDFLVEHHSEVLLALARASEKAPHCLVAP